MRASKKGGLDALFTKVFADDSVKNAISSLHSEFTPSPLPITTPASSLSVEPAGVINQATEQTNKQASDQANNIANKQTDNQSVEQTIKQTNQHFINQFNKQPSKQTNDQAIEHASDQLVKQTIEQTTKQTIGTIPPQSNRQRWLPFNENQGRLLMFLYEKGGGLTNMDIVVAETGIAYGTARAGIDVLIREGYITYKARHNGHSFRGFEYAMNNHLCSLYATRIHGEQVEQSTGQPPRQSSNQTIRQAIGQTGNQTHAVVSSYKDLQTTTTETVDILRDPELTYWKEKGVSNRKIYDWSEEFQMPVDQVIQSLKYCRYEMVVLNQEEEKQIAKPDNWFYKIMQRSGVYPKPASYKSLAEIRAEQMEQAAKEAAEARERQYKAESDLAFQKILDNPNGSEYQALYAQVGQLPREMGGKMLETALREVFDKGRG